MSGLLQQSYDASPYQSFPFPQSHPDRLATIGALFGMEPAPVDQCRVLEVGCASGGNLIPVAAALPGSEFVGIDLSAVQIERGQADVAELGLTNIRLVAMDIRDFSPEFGRFDYVIAHGVYSWVPPAVQEALFAICAGQLSPGGIAYVSYNTLPGWRTRGALRDAMILHTRGIADPKTRVVRARAVLDFLAEAVRDDTSVYGSAVRTEAERLRKQGDYYILHDHLEEQNEPLYFGDFIERAARHKLAYLGEADFGTMLASELPPHVRDKLAAIAPDALRREQFMDFIRNRTFRETLLVREGMPLARKISPLRVMALRVASKARAVREAPDLRSSALEEFRTPDGKGVSTPSPVFKAFMAALADHWPVALPFDDLHTLARAKIDVPGEPDPSERTQLASQILKCYARGVVELHHTRSPFVLDAGERPETSAVARLQARRGNTVTSLQHEHGTFGDDTRRLFLLLDGTRTRGEIAAALWPGVPESESLAELHRALVHFGRLALIAR